MAPRILFCLALVCAIPSTSVVAQTSNTDTVPPSSFAGLDRNGDGWISRIEWAVSYRSTPPAQKGVEVVGPDGSVQILIPRPVTRGDDLDWSDPADKAQVAAREALALHNRPPSMADAAQAVDDPVQPNMGFDTYDVDGDDRVSRAEWQAFQGPRPPDP
jgi:hypothetical protein